MKKGDQIELTVTDYAFGGKGIAKVPTEEGQQIYFIDNTIPGQRVSAQITKKRKRYVECRLLNVIERSPQEIEIPYQPISGSPYVTLPIREQMAYKQSSVIELFRRIGGIENAADLFEEFIASPNDWHYRNKMEYSFSSIRHDLELDQEFDDFGLGFKRRGTWWKVENLDKSSGLFDEQLENNLHRIREWCRNTGLPAWHPPKKTGFFRHIVVRKSFAQDKILINLVTSSEGLRKFPKDGFVDVVQEILGERLAGIQHTINDNVADRSKIENGNTELLFGDRVITEELHGLSFEISMESFFQTNPSSAERLYQKVIDYTTEDNDLNGQVIMDLFCGTGTIGQIIAKGVSEVEIIGVDLVEEAIENAERNAELNGLKNVKFFASDVGKFIFNYPEYVGQIGTIILDPPRAGIAPKTLRKVMNLGAQRIVYVSCNPSTQARDFIELIENGYKIEKFSLVDQFPHTAHVEAVALLSR